MPRLCFNEKLRVRQYIISDPSTIHYTECYSAPKENSSADWQQQVKKTPTNFHDLGNQFDGQQNKTTTTHPLPLIDNNNAYYPDLDLGFDPYWDIHIYNQHHLQFHNNYIKTAIEKVSHSSEIDQNLNTNISQAFVVPWQNIRVTIPLASYEEPMELISGVGN